jgi:hypothetical protein
MRCVLEPVNYVQEHVESETAMFDNTMPLLGRAAPTEHAVLVEHVGRGVDVVGACARPGTSSPAPGPMCTTAGLMGVDMLLRWLCALALSGLSPFLVLAVAGFTSEQMPVKCEPCKSGMLRVPVLPLLGAVQCEGMHGAAAELGHSDSSVT